MNIAIALDLISGLAFLALAACASEGLLHMSGFGKHNLIMLGIEQFFPAVLILKGTDHDAFIKRIGVVLKKLNVLPK